MEKAWRKNDKPIMVKTIRSLILSGNESVFKTYTSKEIWDNVLRVERGLIHAAPDNMWYALKMIEDVYFNKYNI